MFSGKLNPLSFFHVCVIRSHSFRGDYVVTQSEFVFKHGEFLIKPNYNQPLSSAYGVSLAPIICMKNHEHYVDVEFLWFLCVNSVSLCKEARPFCQNCGSEESRNTKFKVKKRTYLVYIYLIKRPAWSQTSRFPCCIPDTFSRLLLNTVE